MTLCQHLYLKIKYIMNWIVVRRNSTSAYEIWKFFLMSMKFSNHMNIADFEDHCFLFLCDNKKLI